jgi:hypothetical protein
MGVMVGGGNVGVNVGRSVFVGWIVADGRTVAGIVTISVGVACGTQANKTVDINPASSKRRFMVPLKIRDDPTGRLW